MRRTFRFSLNAAAVYVPGTYEISNMRVFPLGDCRDTHGEDNAKTDAYRDDVKERLDAIEKLLKER